MARGEPIDPKNLIRESFRIEGISEPECRVIFLDWALSLPAPHTPATAIPQLLERHAAEPGDHPMRKVLNEGLQTAAQTGRRGGRAARVPQE